MCSKRLRRVRGRWLATPMTRGQKVLVTLAIAVVAGGFFAARALAASEASGYAWPVLWAGVGLALALVAACALFEPDKR